jgi:hypothetical protein
MATKISPQTGIGGKRLTAPGHLETVLAIQITRSTPQVIGANAKPSSPNGMSMNATTVHGMTQSAVVGTATMFVISQ